MTLCYLNALKYQNKMQVLEEFGNMHLQKLKIILLNVVILVLQWLSQHLHARQMREEAVAI